MPFFQNRIDDGAVKTQNGYCHILQVLPSHCLFVRYIVIALLSLECASIAYDNLKQYNRGSIFRLSLYKFRCCIRDIVEGQTTMPHLLHYYLVACFLWASHSSFLSQSLQWDAMALFAARLFLRGRHYGGLCRLMSIWVAVLAGLLSGIPTIPLLAAAFIEAVYPTLGDDDGADAMLTNHPGHVKAMHPGYVGTENLLDAPVRMAPDGLCLYHCLAAAANYADYMALSVPLRAVLAEQLRQTTICLLYTSPSPRDKRQSRMPSSA